MDIKRITLYSSIAFVIFLLWSAWEKDHPRTIVPQSQTIQSLQSTSDSNDLEVPASQEPESSLEPIQVQTDVLDLKIDLKHGDVVGADLIKYPESVHSDIPFTLLSDKSGERYVASSMLVSKTQQGYRLDPLRFQSKQTHYRLDNSQQELVVDLEGTNESGLLVTKRFTLKRGSYLIQVEYVIKNNAELVWSGFVDTRLSREAASIPSTSLFQIGTYTGASYSEPGVHRYQKVSFEQMTKDPLNIKAKGGWIAMQQHYFLSAWIPNQHQENHFYTQAADSHYAIGANHDEIVVKPGQKIQTMIQLYLGPEIAPILKNIAPGLDLTVDYGWFWFISSALLSMMAFIEKVFGNWGWSIIFITILIKLAFYQLSAKSYQSMANMRKIQPKMEALKARYGDDKAKLSQATMELYKEEKINPLGGCLPIIVQIPVFIALYWALIESVEFRQAPFIFWINDLSAPDAYHVLPVIMGLTMLIQQRLNPTPPDPVQAKMMMFLPLLFVGLFWNFPSGLVLYWIVNNILSILQQWWITRKIESAPKRKTSSVK